MSHSNLEPTAPAPPVCPRHPDRISYTNCQRCGRPACPECQRPAAVGFHCVDCVRETAREAPSQRTVLGGQAAADQRPLVTWSIIAICIVVWVLQLTNPRFSFDISLVPFYGESEPWRFITSAFAHSPTSPLHVGFNMFALYMVGPPLERLLGRLRFLAVYLISAVAGGAGFLLLNPVNSGVSLVGASGAVFGLFGAFLVISRKLGAGDSGIISVLVINAVLGFIIPNVAWQAHLGGFIGGVLAALAITLPGRDRSSLHWVGLGVLSLIIVGLIAAKYAFGVPVHVG